AKTLFKILEANKHISSQATQILTVYQSTPRMREIRRLDLPDRKSFYEKNRIEDQHIWYISKCQENDKKSSFWFSALIAVNALAIVFALLRALFPSAQNWPTDIFVAASGSLMAWLQTKRFQELAASYTLAAHEIGLFRLSLGHIQDEKALSDFVGDAENAFSREHTQWQARRDAI
ncbi:MAG: SLATT domain-containing protein, partial [Acetobacteraceae bacterium]